MNSINKPLMDQIQGIQYEKVALEEQRDVYKDQLEECQDIITHLRTRYVDHTKDPGKDIIVMIIEKDTAPEEDEGYNDGSLTQKNDGLKHDTPIINL